MSLRNKNIFSALKTLSKIVVETAVLPIALAVDVVRLPYTAYNDKDPFEKLEGQCEK